MINIERFEKAKRKVEKYKTQEAKLAGALEEIQRRIKTEFGCDTLEDAQALGEKKEKKAEQLEEKFNALMDEFEREWDELVEES